MLKSNQILTPYYFIKQCRDKKAINQTCLDSPWFTMQTHTRLVGFEKICRVKYEGGYQISFIMSGKKETIASCLFIRIDYSQCGKYVQAHTCFFDVISRAKCWSITAPTCWNCSQEKRKWSSDCDMFLRPGLYAQPPGLPIWCGLFSRQTQYEDILSPTFH